MVAILQTNSFEAMTSLQRFSFFMVKIYNNNNTVWIYIALYIKTWLTSPRFTQILPLADLWTLHIRYSFSLASPPFLSLSLFLAIFAPWGVLQENQAYYVKSPWATTIFFTVYSLLPLLRMGEARAKTTGVSRIWTPDQLVCNQTPKPHGHLANDK